MKRRTPGSSSLSSSSPQSSKENMSMADSKSTNNASHRRHHRHHSDSTGAKISRFVARAREKTIQTVQVQVRTIFNNSESPNPLLPSTSATSSASNETSEDHNDRLNYALLILLYTLQGIPMGLSASIPFLLQEKITKLAAAAAGAGAATAAAAGTAAAANTALQATKASYNANAIFALCSWPFSLKLLWAPIVDAVYFSKVGRRKSWLVPIQSLAGLLMVGGADFVENQLGLGHLAGETTTTNVKGVTAFFFGLYFLMATQDIAVDGWALTMLSKKNRGKGPICNSIGQNIGYFLSFVGFLALNDIEASETLWRPLLRMPSNPTKGLISLKGFLRFMGFLMLATTGMVAVFKRELTTSSVAGDGDIEDDDDAELDASEIGLKETYHRLWAVCQLPSVRWLFLILVTYRLPVALSDNVKFLKAVEYGLSKSTTALLSPTLILPLGILVPIIAHKIWHQAPMQQFAKAYQFRVTLIPMLDLILLHLLQSGYPHNSVWFWLAVIASTAGQAICNSLQFNAQMIFFASRVDPAIGGSYMTLLNTAANLGGTWPASFVMWLIGILTGMNGEGGSGRDPYFGLQTIFSVLGIAWLVVFQPKLQKLAALPDDAWRTHLLDEPKTNLLGGPTSSNLSKDIESGETSVEAWQSQQNTAKNK